MAVLPGNTNEKLHVVRFQLVRRQVLFERLFGLELFVELVAAFDQGIDVFCPRRQAGEEKQRTKHPERAKATIRIHQRKYSSPGDTHLFLSNSPLITIWAAKAGQRRSSYTVPCSGAECDLPSLGASGGKAPPWNWRILLNGKGDELMYEHQLIVTGGLPFAELKARSLINSRAQAADGSPDFSKLIRVGLPLCNDEI
jgi:hypothetical protein